MCSPDPEALAFVGRVSHELRAPLTAIHGYVDLIDMGVHGPVTARQRADLECIRESERQLIHLINDLLDLVKVQSGNLAYRSMAVPLRSILTSTVRLMAPAIEKKGLSGPYLTAGPDVAVLGDPDRVHQILTNLLVNAIKFTPTGGTIRMECDITGDVVHVQVTDNGVGIPPELCGAIFEPFVQAANDVIGSRQGVGLGLAISRAHARAMNGDLTVKSVLGKGSRFTLTLPRARWRAPRASVRCACS